MSDTPRSDELYSKTKGENYPFACGQFTGLCRQLETELAELRAEIDKVHQIALDYARERDEAKAELAKVREALRDAISVFRDSAQIVTSERIEAWSYALITGKDGNEKK